jgi:hypothetical protein
MDLVTEAVDASSLAVSAVAEIEAGLAALHGSGSWEGATAPVLAAAVWDEAKAGHVGSGSFGQEVQSHATPAEVKTQADQALIDFGTATAAGVATRAAPGDAMTLTTGERLAVAGKVWDEALPGAHGAGTAGKMVSDLEARLTAARAAALDQIPGMATSLALVAKILRNRLELAEGSTNNWVLYDDDSVTPLLRWSVGDKNGDAIRMNAFVPARRTRGA